MGNVLGTLYAILGLIFGAIMTLISLVVPGATRMYGALFGVGSIVLFYGIMAFVLGLIIALLYNLVAYW